MRMRSSLIAVLASAALALGLTGCPDLVTGGDPKTSPTSEQSPVPANVHEGTIGSDQTWKKADSPHVVTGDVYVESASGATLTIEPGTEVRFEQGTGLYFGWSGGTSGVLKAIGTSTESITFTSASAMKAKGDWKQIYLGSGAASSVMSYCRLAYAGGDGTGDSAALRVSGSANKPSISNCTLEENNGTAVLLDDQASFTAFASNAVKTSEHSPMRLDAAAVGTLGAGNTFEANGLQALEVVASTVAKNARWRSFGIPYLMLGDVYVEGSNAPVLTIDAGNTLRFTQGSSLRVAWSGGTSGALYAVGTAAAPITLTGVESNANPGAWDYLYLGDGSVNGASGNPLSTCLQYVTIQYGGGSGGTDMSGLWIEDCVPYLDHVTLRQNAGFGLRVTGTLGNVPAQSVLEDGRLTFDGNAEGTLSFL